MSISIDQNSDTKNSETKNLETKNWEEIIKIQENPNLEDYENSETSDDDLSSVNLSEEEDNDEVRELMSQS